MSKVIQVSSMFLIFISCQTMPKFTEADSKDKIKQICSGKEEICESLPDSSDPYVISSNIDLLCKQYPELCKKKSNEFGIVKFGFDNSQQQFLAPAVLKNAILKANAQPFHGKWCGRGNCQQKPNSEYCKKYEDKINAIDEVDEACHEHDVCYNEIVKETIDQYPPKPNTVEKENTCDSTLIGTVTPFAKKVRLFDKTPGDKKLTAASAILLYFKFLKISSQIDEEDYKQLKKELSNKRK